MKRPQNRFTKYGAPKVEVLAQVYAHERVSQPGVFGSKSRRYRRNLMEVRPFAVEDVMSSDERDLAPFRDEDHVVRRREADET